MSMLAEKKKKRKLQVNPTPAWVGDKTKFGQRMLEKMGWSEGCGLGKDLQGTKENIKVSQKSDTRGLGYSSVEDVIPHQANFDKLLSELNTTLNKESTRMPISSLEAQSEKLQSRIHYSKVVRSKDVSRYSHQDLVCILGAAAAKSAITVETGEKVEVQTSISENVSTESVKSSVESDSPTESSQPENSYDIPREPKKKSKHKKGKLKKHKSPPKLTHLENIAETTVRRKKQKNKKRKKSCEQEVKQEDIGLSIPMKKSKGKKKRKKHHHHKIENEEESTTGGTAEVGSQKILGGKCPAQKETHKRPQCLRVSTEVENVSPKHMQAQETVKNKKKKKRHKKNKEGEITVLKRHRSHSEDLISPPTKKLKVSVPSTPKKVPKSILKEKGKRDPEGQGNQAGTSKQIKFRDPLTDIIFI